jgi:hypothetical protein
MLKLAAKHNEQNATVWQRLPNNSEEDTLHGVISQGRLWIILICYT